jgi:rhodanese-related sulfurtransferase
MLEISGEELTMYLRFRLMLSCLAVLLPFVCAQGSDAQGRIDEATWGEAVPNSPEVSTAELRTILREHTATVIDARPFREYALGHIPGALNAAPKPGVPMSLYISDVDEVGRLTQQNNDAPIVLYCDGPFCVKAKQLAEGLIAEGYSNVKRYQLGLSVWRALGGPVQIELAGAALIMARYPAALFVDARDHQEFAHKTLPGAKNLPRNTLVADKDGNRMEAGKYSNHPLVDDYNTRIVVFGDDQAQASAVAEVLTRESYSNVAYFCGSLEELLVASEADKHK